MAASNCVNSADQQTDNCVAIGATPLSWLVESLMILSDQNTSSATALSLLCVITGLWYNECLLVTPWLIRQWPHQTTPSPSSDRTHACLAPVNPAHSACIYGSGVARGSGRPQAINFSCKHFVPVAKRCSNPSTPSRSCVREAGSDHPNERTRNRTAQREWSRWRRAEVKDALLDRQLDAGQWRNVKCRLSGRTFIASNNSSLSAATVECSYARAGL